MKLFSQNTKHKFWLLVSTPAILLVILFILSSYYNHLIFRNQVKHQALSTLELFSAQSEKSIMTVSSYLKPLVNNSEFMSFLNNKNMSVYPEINNIQSVLKDFEETFDYIDNIFILAHDKSTIITPDGIFDAQTYFQSVYNYTDYTYEYWFNFKYLTSDPYRILSPTVIKDTSEPKQIVPIIFRQIGSSKINNLLVVNPRLDIITKTNESFKYTPNTKFYILNKYTGKIFSNYPDGYNVSILNTELYNNLVKNEEAFSYIDENNIKYTVFSYSSTNHLLGYTYFSMVPNSDLNKVISPITLLALLFLIIFIVIIILTTIRNTNVLISPILQLAQQFNKGKELPDNDLLGILTKSTSSLIKTNNDLSITLPYALEKYLIDYLNDIPTYYKTSDDALLRSQLPFTNKYFRCVIACIQPTNKLFETFSSIEYANFKQAFFEIVRDMFISQFNAFILSSEKDTLCIILNSDVLDTTNNKIDELVCRINNLLKNDGTYIDFYIGIGNMYEGFEGLKQSYQSALKSLNIQPKNTPQLNMNKDKRTIKYILTPNDETKLLSLLLAHSHDDAVELVNQCVINNKDVDMRSLKQFFSQMLTIVFKAMRMKNIEYDENKNDTELIADILKKSPDDIHKTILSLIQNFKYSSTNIKLNANEIIEYINEHYKENELSLEYLADTFGCSLSYLSSFLKNSLGMGYLQYITFLRIEEAKHLLKHTSKPIQDIFKEVGFSNKQTFVRTFKNIANITPSEYRKTEKRNTK